MNREVYGHVANRIQGPCSARRSICWRAGSRAWSTSTRRLRTVPVCAGADGSVSDLSPRGRGGGMAGSCSNSPRCSEAVGRAGDAALDETLKAEVVEAMQSELDGVAIADLIRASGPQPHCAAQEPLRRCDCGSPEPLKPRKDWRMAKNKVVITCAITGAIHTPTMSSYLPVTPKQIRTRLSRPPRRARRSCIFMRAIPRMGDRRRTRNCSSSSCPPSSRKRTRS